MVSRKKAPLNLSLISFGICHEEVIADNLKAVCSWIFHLTTEGLGELTGLETSCTKYLLRLVFQMRGTHLMLCNKEGEEGGVVHFNHHIPTS